MNALRALVLRGRRAATQLGVGATPLLAGMTIWEPNGRIRADVIAVGAVVFVMLGVAFILGRRKK